MPGSATILALYSLVQRSLLLSPEAGLAREHANTKEVSHQEMNRRRPPKKCHPPKSRSRRCHWLHEPTRQLIIIIIIIIVIIITIHLVHHRRSPRLRPSDARTDANAKKRAKGHPTMAPAGRPQRHPLVGRLRGDVTDAFHLL
ncbi:hypothetical protein DIPPA_08040 [Diplonema papillatum]|nr:hypothetical protein DIPPA_08040 [Diplonema papillatum]